MIMGIRRNRRGEAGFTLIEAIVALVVVGATLVPLLTLLNRNIDAVRRIGEANIKNEAMLNAIAVIQGSNPMLYPTGTETIGPYRMQWTANPLFAPVDGVGFPAGESLYQVALYSVTVDLARPSGKTDPASGGPAYESWFSFDIRQVGWKQVRQFRLPF